MATSNIGTGFPYGDAFIANTPETDRAGQYLLQEQRYRQAKMMQENSQLDNSFRNEFYKIRSADTNDVLDKYNTYKQLKIQTLNPKNQRDIKTYNALQHQANLAQADLFDTINQSAEAKNKVQQLAAERKAHPEKFVDNFGDLINAYNSTPLSGLANHKLGDLTNPDTYRYKGNLTNLAPMLQKAAGTPRELNSTTELTPDKQQNKITSYKGYNNPYDYYNNLVNGLVGSNAARDLVGSNNFTPEQQQLIESKFQELQNNPNYKAAYNIPQGMDFPMSAYTTDAGKAARLLAMQHAINNVPSANPKFVNIPSARDAAVLRRQQIMEGIRFNDAKAKIQLHHDLSQLDAQDQAKYVGGLYDQLKQDALSGQNPLSQVTSVKDIFAYRDDKGHKEDPNEINYTKDGNVQAIFYKKDADGNTVTQDGKPVVDPDKTTTIKDNEFKIRWSKNLLGTTAAKNVATKKDEQVNIPHAKKGMFD